MKFNSKSSIKVIGKMSAEDTGIVAKHLSLAALIFACFAGLALFISVIRWW